MIELVVNARIEVPKLPPEILSGLKKLFEHDNPVYRNVKRQLDALPHRSSLRTRLYAQLKSEPEQIITWRSGEAGEVTFPRGGLSKIVGYLESKGFALYVDDQRWSGAPVAHAPMLVEPNSELQLELIESILEEENGIVRAPTATGKTFAIITAIVRSGMPGLVIVDRTALMRQWVKEVAKFCGPDADVGTIGDGKKRLAPITIAMRQSLVTMAKNAKEWSRLLDYFGFVAVDEVHLSAASTFIKIVDAFPAYYRIGVSDSEKRKDRREFLVYDAFGDVFMDVDRTKLVESGAIFDPEIRIFRTGFHSDWWEGLQDADKAVNWGRMLELLATSRERNEILVRTVEAEIGNGGRGLLLSHRREHCSSLLSYVLSGPNPHAGLMLGGAADAAAFELTKLRLQDGSMRLGVGTYQACGTALDIPCLTFAVCGMPIHGNRSQLKQVRGRISRAYPGKEVATMHYAWDEHFFGLAPLENICAISKRVTLVQPDGSIVDAKAWLKAERARRRSA